NWIRAHPCRTAFVLLSILAIVLASIIAPHVLAAIGFTTVGPVAGTTAAAIQSVISPVGAGSAFAIPQSAAMGGYGLPIVVGFAQAIGIATTG
ncbi:uncharacterized protein K452DRAFT_196939, partial [Aplosporella prunicola CBS 121167]